VRLVLLSCVLAACSGAIGQPAWRTVAPQEVAAASVFAPMGEPAARYNDAAPPVPRSPLADRLVATVAAVSERNGKAAPAADGRLYAVAEDLARFAGDGPPPESVVEFALGYHGIIEPSPHIVRLSMTPGDDASVAAELETRLSRMVAQTTFARVGVGVAATGPGVQTVVLALQKSGVETEPIPRELPRGGALRLRGRVLYPYSAPGLYVTRQDGTVQTPPVVHDGAAGFRADVRCGDATGVLKIEVVAEEGRDNPADLANFAVPCGEPAPRTLALLPGDGSADADAADDDGPTVERKIFALANRDRARAGLLPLVWDDRAAAIARRHSEDMRAGEYVAHVSPTAGTLADRARAGGLATPLLLENLARSYSAAEAEDGLMASPGHRENLMNAQATHLGIGVAIGSEVAGHHELYVTQLFFRRPPLADRLTARAAILSAFAGARRAARLPPLVSDDVLDAIAERHAAAVAAGASRSAADAQSNAALDQTADRFVQVLTVIEVTGDPTEHIPPDVVRGTARSIGLGVAQGTHATLGEGAYYMVVLLAQPR
jgi:uncharacterized protein YkwD